MTLMDRYILRMYVRVLLICGFSFTGMYVVADAFNNVDEFIMYGQDASGGVLGVISEYYSPRVLTFLNMASGLLALTAAMFTVASMQRSREMTALLAGGIPGMRVAAPMIAASILVAGLGVVNREVWIPQHRAALARNAQNWKGEQARPVQPSFDHVTQIYLDGNQTYWGERRIVEPNFRLPRRLREVGRKLQGAEAVYLEADGERPAGFRIDDVTEPRRLLKQPSVALNGKNVILTPADTPWLEPNQCFVVSDVTFEQLSNRDAWRQYASSRELIAALHNPSLDYGADVRVTIHSRVVQPILDVLLVLIGLPLVMTRRAQNVFVSVGKCLVLVVVFWVLVMGAHGAGNAYLLSPATAAWAPVVLLGPAAVLMIHSLWE